MEKKQGKWLWYEEKAEDIHVREIKENMELMNSLKKLI